MSTSIAADTVVGLRYVLRNSTGETLDRSEDDDPLLYLHGHSNIVPGLERALDGKATGDKLVVVVAPEDGYGAREAGAERKVPRGAFPDDVELEVGMELVMEDTKTGDEQPFWIKAVGADTVTIDLNHPLAGVELHFDVEVLSVRAATAEELDHGHPHGPGGHHHH